MSQMNYTLESKKNKHLTIRERYQIEVLAKENMKPLVIAQRLGRHVRTIERELKKGMVELLNSNLTYRKAYCADTAQRIYQENSQNKGANLKLGNDHKLAKHIEIKIVKDKYSPDAVIGEIKAKGLAFKTSICTKTLYNYIDQGIFATLSNKDLPVKKDKTKRKYQKVRIPHKNLKGTSIEDRPSSIEERVEYGHWEMDCVVGKQGGSGAALLVLSERKSREEIIYKMASKTQECVLKVLDTLEKKQGKKFKEKFNTITVDNGSEFLDYKSLERSISNPNQQRVKIYYAHPYSSWERGTNENSNKLIRRFIPKGTDMSTVSQAMIKRIETWMNNYPRKIFGYKTAKEMVY